MTGTGMGKRAVELVLQVLRASDRLPTWRSRAAGWDCQKQKFVTFQRGQKRSEFSQFPAAGQLV